MKKFLLEHHFAIGITIYLVAVALCGAVVFWTASGTHEEPL